MFEKVTHVAEQTATNVSRRECLGRLGRGAAAAAAALAGLLAFPVIAQAGKRIQRCSNDSGFYCAGSYVGAPCGMPQGQCAPVDKHDRSDVVLCTCQVKGKKGKKP